MLGFCSKQSHQMISEDICSLNPQFASPVSGEDFFVDQLLNFNNVETSEEDEDSNGDLLFSLKKMPMEEKEPSKNSEVSSFLSPTPPPLETEPNRDDFGSQLSIQAEEKDLEWLSQFVEESFSQFSTTYPPGLGPGPGPLSDKPRKTEPSKGLSKSRRSKRTRSGGRVWSMALTELSCSQNSNSDPNRYRAKKRVRGSEPGSVQPRRCSHCGVQKTPQWRAGPLGAKTLCNACGVRFKSGRLLPEYRPACSPTFSSELHSNNHRKVLEMRRQKEV